MQLSKGDDMTETQQKIETLASQEAFNALIDSLKSASQLMLGELNGADKLDALEGFRHVLRVLSFASDVYLEEADPLHPSFTPVETHKQKIFGDNPDAIYDRAPLNGLMTYRITGKSGDQEYLGFCVYNRNRENRIGANISDREMEFNPDGSFEIILSQEKHPGNWLKLEKMSYELITRQYFLDRDSEKPATYKIECLSPEASSPPPLLSDDGLARALRGMARFIPEAVNRSVQIAPHYIQHPNQFLHLGDDHPVFNLLSPTPDNRYHLAWYDIGLEEALVVEVNPPDSRYWALMFFNRWWEFYEYRHRPVVINKKQAKMDADGSVKIIVAHQDPEVPNWLDTEGHTQGYLIIRWMQCEEAALPACKVLPFEELGKTN
jgi:hypothetical protein